MRNTRRRKNALNVTLVLIAGIVALSLFSACTDFSFYSVLDGTEGPPTWGIGAPDELSIAPSSITVAAGGTVTFSASGGTSPYTFSVTGDGTIDAASGEYTAPLSAGTATVTVTDAADNTAQASVTVEESVPSPLSISPSPASITADGEIAFIASGGTGPYTFSIADNQSGSPGIGAVSGIYTAGSTWGVVDVIQVQDAAQVIETANVTVTPPPDYTITDATFPGYGSALGSFNGSFTIEEILGNTGAQEITWKLYVSTDAILDVPGDSLEKTGTEQPLTGLGSTVVSFTGAGWPAGSDTYRYLFVTIESADDSGGGNNEYASAAIPIPSSTLSESEPNDSPPPPGETTSYQELGLISGPAMVGIIDATMDGAVDSYDTYRFTTDTGINRADIVCTWNTGADDIDIYIWEDGAGSVLDSSTDTNADREPSPGMENFRVNAVNQNTTYRVGVRFKTTSTSTYTLSIHPN